VHLLDAFVATAEGVLQLVSLILRQLSWDADDRRRRCALLVELRAVELRGAGKSERRAVLLDWRRRAECRACGEEWDMQDRVGGQLHADIVFTCDGVDRCAVNHLDGDLVRI
jgi:hypothetical protein